MSNFNSQLQFQVHRHFLIVLVWSYCGLYRRFLVKKDIGLRFNHKDYSVFASQPKSNPDALRIMQVQISTT